MKAKKLELRPGIGEWDGEQGHDLYIDGKKIENNVFYYNKGTKHSFSEDQYSKKDIKKIFSCSFSELPDKIHISNFFLLKPDMASSCLSFIIRSGKKCTLEYLLTINSTNSMTLWNSKTFLLKLVENLEKKGFKKYPKDRIDIDDDGEANFQMTVIHNNLKDNIGETDKKYSEIIQHAEKETHAHMLKLAIAEGKKKFKS